MVDEDSLDFSVGFFSQFSDNSLINHDNRSILGRCHDYVTVLTGGKTEDKLELNTE